MHDWSGEYSSQSLHSSLIELGCYPSFSNLIESQINFYEWWEHSKSNYIIRKSKDYPFLIESIKDNVRLIASDNEACASFYQFMYGNTIEIKKDLFEFFVEKRLEVGIPKTKYPQQKITINKIGLKGGMKKGIREGFNLKLSHYVDAARLLNSFDNIKKRSAIYLSPFNIFLTPKPLRKNKGYLHYMNKTKVYDIGEEEIIKHQLHALLIKDILLTKNGKLAYKLYCKMCELDFESQINYINSSSYNDILIEFKKPSEKINNKKNPVNLSSVNLIEISKTRFYVDERIFKELQKHPTKGLKITVNPIKGKHPKGYYILSNKQAVDFIRSKRNSKNWDNNRNFHQDGVPRELSSHFQYL